MSEIPNAVDIEQRRIIRQLRNKNKIPDLSKLADGSVIRWVDNDFDDETNECAVKDGGSWTVTYRFLGEDYDRVNSDELRAYLESDKVLSAELLSSHRTLKEG